MQRTLRVVASLTPTKDRSHIATWLVCGILILLGAFTRVAAAVMVVNFVVALAMVHTRLPFREALDPSAMLAGSLFLLFHGAGAPSIDAWRELRSAARTSARRVVSYSR
jgi:putative oxidoreductase